MPIIPSKYKPGIAAELEKRGLEEPERLGPLWKGPEVDGITQSLLGRFLACRERFRLLVVEGLKPTERWNHRTGYGDMWHCCEEALAGADGPHVWDMRLTDFAKEVVKQFPVQQTEINKWYQVCRLQFPLYVEWWKNHPDVQERENLYAEQEFDGTYVLPSKRKVRLRGKWDSVDLIDGLLWLQENKTKSDIYGPRIQQQLRFDLQTMLYLVSLKGLGHKIGGVRYNVVRRPLSGGKGSITQLKTIAPRPTKNGKGMTKGKKGETEKEFYARLAETIRGAVGLEWDMPVNQHYFFQRWTVDITTLDIQKFENEFLIPVLENLCDWWDMIEASIAMSCSPFELHNNRLHWRYPYGVYNPIAEGGSSDYDNYLETGSQIGLQRVPTLFPELKHA